MLKSILLAGAAAFAATAAAQPGQVVDDITPAKAAPGGTQADAQVTTTDRQPPATAPAGGPGLGTSVGAQLGDQPATGEGADPPHQMQQPHQQLPAAATGTAQVQPGTDVPAGTGAVGTVQSGAVGMTGPTGHAGQSGVTGAAHGSAAETGMGGPADAEMEGKKKEKRKELRRGPEN